MFVLESDVFPLVAANSFSADHLPNTLGIYIKHFHGTVLFHFPKHAVTIHLSKHEASIEGQVNFSLFNSLH